MKNCTILVSLVAALLLSVHVFAAELPAGSQSKPNIIFILVDDMGYSDIGCFGGEIETPNIDGLARHGLRFTQFYNTGKCFPSRACLLTGVYAQQIGMDMPDTYRGGFRNARSIGEVLHSHGYRTYASGKHHSGENLIDRGFDHYFGLMEGACNFWNPGYQQRKGEPPPGAKKKVIRAWTNDGKMDNAFTPPIGFYATDAFTDKALEWLDEPQLNTQPFFLYLPYTAPHYPLHAWPEDIAKYKGRYDAGYEAIRQQRHQRMQELGIIDSDTPLPAWKGADWSAMKSEDKALMRRRMEVYAAMVDRVDQNIGRVLAKLKQQGKLENTLIMFASDNGGCAETTRAKQAVNTVETIGKVESYDTVYRDWATVQNTPLRFWKNYSHEGGICTPLIVFWPGNITDPGRITHQPGHFIDILATFVDITSATYPTSPDGKATVPLRGISLRPAFTGEPLRRDEPLFWHWMKGGAIREANWKAVFWQDNWQLFDLDKDRNEQPNLARKHPNRLRDLKAQWQAWSEAKPTFNKVPSQPYLGP
ncbi:MAG: arylsulfatase [Aureliella sp.]